MFETAFHFIFSSKDNQILVVSGHEYYLKRKKTLRTETAGNIPLANAEQQQLRVENFF